MQILLFDIDGTLLSTGGAGQSAMERTLAVLFQTSQALEGISFAGRTDRAISEDLFRFFDVPYTDENWQRFQREYEQHLQTELHRKNGRVLPGVAQLLDQLASHDEVKLGLLTGNLARGAEIKLRHFGLFDYFEFGGFGDHHSDRDDVARSVFRELQQSYSADLDPAEVWVIGDTPADVQCGRAIGARVVAVATGLYEMEELATASPDHLFADFTETDRILGMLN